MTDEDFMRVALEAARAGVKAGEMPFGACLAREGQVVVAAHNSAGRLLDTTAHAEIQAIRDGCRQLDSMDLSGATLYATCEPCAMCMAACLWCKISRVVFASRIEDAERVSITQLPITAVQMKQLARATVTVEGDVLRAEGNELFKAWSALGGPRRA